MRSLGPSTMTGRGFARKYCPASQRINSRFALGQGLSPFRPLASVALFQQSSDAMWVSEKTISLYLLYRQKNPKLFKNLGPRGRFYITFTFSPVSGSQM